VKSYVKRYVKRVVAHISALVDASSRARRDVDLVLAAAMREPDALARLHFPVAYAQFLRESLEPCRHRLTQVKRLRNSANAADNRFDMLCHALRVGPPALDYHSARDIAVIADGYRNLSQSIEFKLWAGDVGLHFSEASSFGQKGRILFDAVRIVRPQRCLELGTAYGMSALFILAALKAFVPGGSLATVEGWDPLYALSSPMLKQHYGEMVSCTLGSTSVVLPELVKSLGKIDFLFHDAGHSREDYINDFSKVVDYLAPGAVVLFDDIRWEDARVGVSHPHTYEGWQAVHAHPRVRDAVEIDDMIGLLLIQ
jgi:predicted O-methyltransferase YrrM